MQHLVFVAPFAACAVRARASADALRNVAVDFFGVAQEHKVQCAEIVAHHVLLHDVCEAVGVAFKVANVGVRVVGGVFGTLEFERVVHNQVRANGGLVRVVQRTVVLVEQCKSVLALRMEAEPEARACLAEVLQAVLAHVRAVGRFVHAKDVGRNGAQPLLRNEFGNGNRCA